MVELLILGMQVDFSLSQIIMSIVAGVFALLVGIIGYFINQTLVSIRTSIEKTNKILGEVKEDLHDHDKRLTVLEQAKVS